MKVEVYSDGSATTADKPGGYAYVVIVDGVKSHEFAGGIAKSTNNVAELTAAVEGLKYVKNDPVLSQGEVILVSDSQLVLGYANGSFKCKKLHLALLHANLRKLHDELNVTTRWERGHQGEPNNERCDELAKSEREKLM